MKPLYELNGPAQFRRLRRLAGAVLARYPLQCARMTPLVHGENTTFRVDAVDGRGYLLRVCRDGYQTEAALRSELMWLDALADAGLVVPRPVRGLDGDLLQVAAAAGVPEPRRCVVFEWVEGRRRARNRRPNHLYAVGRLMARLHDHAASWTPPPGFARRRLDPEGLAGDASPIGRLGGHLGEARPETRDRLLEAVAVLRARATAHGMPAGHSGLVHADLYRGNVVHAGAEAHAIDFDDAAFAPHLFDIAVALGEVQDSPAHVAAFLAGYRAVRALPDDLLVDLPVFALARTLWVTAWVHDRADNPDIAKLRSMLVTRALGAFERYRRGALVALR